MKPVHEQFSRSRRGFKAAVAAGAILSVAVMAATGFGQVHEIVGGHVLDANPQAGSGGSNTPVPGYVPINGNAIIYGQVSGLARFHGTVGSSSPDVFQENLPSGQIQDFARLTAPQSPTFAPQPYVLPSNIVAGSGGALYSDPINSGFDARLLPGNIISQPQTGTAITGNPLAGAPYTVYDRDLVTTPSETTGTPGRALSDPLFSQRENGPLLDTTGDVKIPAITIPGVQLPAKTPNGRPQKQTNDSEEGSSLEGPNGENRSNAINGRVPSQLVTGQPGQRTNTLAGTNGMGEGSAGGGAGTTGTNGIGGSHQGDMGGSRYPLGQRPNSRPTDLGRTARVTGIYPTLQAELDAAAAKTLAEERAQKPALLNGVQNPSRTANNGTSPPSRSGLAGTGIAGSSTGGPGAIGAVSGTTGEQNTSLADSEAKLRAGQKVAPLKTLADIGPGKTPTPEDVQLKEAETQLKDGKYLDAVDTYQQALVLQPENPLALAGRANAELAAGMYQSAAQDLKFLYSKKPEMASVRYALADFIPQQRIDMVMKDLFKLTTDSKGGNTASFLYCYLAYNTNHPQDLKNELARWEIRSGHDAWQAVAAKAWGQ